MIQHSHQLWASQTRQSVHEHRTELIEYMEDVLARNLTQNYGHGRGIVMTAGNADTLKRVKWTLMMLRGYGCGLPVQIVSTQSLDNGPWLMDSSIFPLRHLMRTTQYVKS